jgi:hypothetical protein
VQNSVNLADLVESLPTSLRLQKSAEKSVQKAEKAEKGKDKVGKGKGNIVNHSKTCVMARISIPDIENYPHLYCSRSIVFTVLVESGQAHLVARGCLSFFSFS